MAETLTYLLRNIPKDLWDAAKHQAIFEGCSLRELILRLLEEYLSDDEEE